MVAPRHRSRSSRRVVRKTPGGTLSMQHKPRKPSAAKCSTCGAQLKGTLRELPSKMANLPKTKKRPERPFGGALCSACMRKHMVTGSRQSSQASN